MPEATIQKNDLPLLILESVSTPGLRDKLAKSITDQLDVAQAERITATLMQGQDWKALRDVLNGSPTREVRQTIIKAIAGRSASEILAFLPALLSYVEADIAYEILSQADSSDPEIKAALEQTEPKARSTCSWLALDLAIRSKDMERAYEIAAARLKALEEWEWHSSTLRDLNERTVKIRENRLAVCASFERRLGGPVRTVEFLRHAYAQMDTRRVMSGEALCAIALHYDDCNLLREALNCSSPRDLRAVHRLLFKHKLTETDRTEICESLGKNLWLTGRRFLEDSAYTRAALQILEQLGTSAPIERMIANDYDNCCVLIEHLECVAPQIKLSSEVISKVIEKGLKRQDYTVRSLVDLASRYNSAIPLEPLQDRIHERFTLALSADANAKSEVVTQLCDDVIAGCQYLLKAEIIGGVEAQSVGDLRLMAAEAALKLRTYSLRPSE